MTGNVSRLRPGGWSCHVGTLSQRGSGVSNRCRAGSRENRAGWVKVRRAEAGRGLSCPTPPKRALPGGLCTMLAKRLYLPGVSALSTTHERVHRVFTGANRGLAPLKRKDCLRRASTRIPPCVFTPLFPLQVRKAKTKLAFLFSIFLSQCTATSAAEFFSRLLRSYSPQEEGRSPSERQVKQYGRI
jgi:hypothetical protein